MATTKKKETKKKTAPKNQLQRQRYHPERNKVLQTLTTTSRKGKKVMVKKVVKSAPPKRQGREGRCQRRYLKERSLQSPKL